MVALLAVVVLHLVGSPARAGEEESRRFAPAEESRSPWPLVLAGAGLAAGIGLGVALKDEADDRYALYRATADPDAARRRFEEAERYDRLSLIGWAAAEVSFVALFILITRDDERPMIPTEGEPLLRAGRDGVEVGWRIAP